MTNQLRVVHGYDITVLSDGDSITQAEVAISEPGSGAYYTLGRGEARRRPGDQRDHTLGEFLALERAFKAAAAKVRLELYARGYYSDIAGADETL